MKICIGIFVILLVVGIVIFTLDLLNVLQWMFPLRKENKKMKDEIVAAQIGTRITNNRGEIIQALTSRTKVTFLSRKRMQMMAAFDLGSKWQALANSQTLFLMDQETGEVEEA